MERSQSRFQRVFTEHQRDVYAYCLRRTNADDALDVAAEVFLTAWRRMEDVPDGESVLPWLYGVARRVLSRQWRSETRLRRLRQRAGSLADSTPDGPESVVVQREELDLVLQALSRLRPADQEVLRLVAWDGLPHATIAGLLGCSVNAVDQRLHRARRRLAIQYRSLARHGRTVQVSTPIAEKGGAA
jgi:RNA polymerase sigma-70 factor (ECF subfamily)